ncbi:MAG: hypothetical protein Q9221_009074 [Calogaya cf. arnoldii]
MIINPALFVPALEAGRGIWDYGNASFGPASLPDRPMAAFGSSKVAGNVLTVSRVIKLEDGGDEQNIGGEQWVVPKGVKANTDLAGVEFETRSYKSGDDAFKEFSGDTDVEARYNAVTTVGGSAGYALKKSFQRNYQYVMMVHNNIQVFVRFVEYDQAINVELLNRRLDLIDPFDSTNTDIVEQYRTLFGTIGSHIITGLDYGDRFQLRVWADNSNQDVDQNFEADVGVEFNGLTTGGSVDAKVKGSTEYNEFMESVQKTISCRGGDEKLQNTLEANIYDPEVFKTYKAWANTTGQNPRLNGFQTMPLWELMASALDKKVVARVHDVQTAYNWIVENPKQHITKATLTISSDWGTIDLLTPSAFFTRDKSHPDDTGAFFSKNKIEWNSRATGPRDVEIAFLIINDGSPIDIALSHGTSGSVGKNGRIIAEFDGKPYINEQHEDKNWNTENYWACSVDPHGYTQRKPWIWAEEEEPTWQETNGIATA